MKLGIFTAVFGKLSFDEMLAAVGKYDKVSAIELGTGCWPGSSHVDVDRLLGSKQAVSEFKSKIQDAGLVISALSCHGNPVHPVETLAKRDDAVFRKTVELAAALDVETVVTFSGCPGGGTGDQLPNWIVAPWPPEYLEALAWQWEERLIPYWNNAGAFAHNLGRRVALEAHPGFCVYNTETLLKLRNECGPAIGINLDPSHLFWQGIDIPTAIAELGDSIYHFHAKDIGMNEGQRRKNGVLDAKSYAQMKERSWLFRSVGWGHDELEWKRIVSALRLAGYDDVISIEHEDALASIDEGLGSAVNFLSRVLLSEPPTVAWWL
jgi:sugar phosphate isomerase/epimerase